MGAVSLFHGLESLEPANCGRIGFDDHRRACDGHTTARRNRQKKERVTLTGEVECDEVYLVAGHKGQPEIVQELGRPGRRRRLKGKRGRGTLDTEKPPVFGMIQRDGDGVATMNAAMTRILPWYSHALRNDRLDHHLAHIRRPNG